MVLRVNNNTAAMNTHRNVIENSSRLMKSLEKLSSGSKVNRASDGAAKLIISEQLRSQVSGLKQAMDNSESAIGMISTAEGALSEVNNLLIKVRGLAAHAANEGANDEVMLKADQFEIDNILSTIDRMTFNTQFGMKKLLDGSQGANGVAMGEGLEFVIAGPNTKDSEVSGYEIRVFRKAERAFWNGSTPLTQELVDNGEELTIAEGGKTVSFKAMEGESVGQALGRFRNEIEAIGLDVDFEVDDDGNLNLYHKQFGSEYEFSVASSSEGVLSTEAGIMQKANAGTDILGTIGGHVAFGRGQILTGGAGTPVTGLKVRYGGDVLADPDGGPGEDPAGRVAVYQNSLVFQVGGNTGQTVRVSLNSTNTRTLSRGIKNESGFVSLRDINVLSPQNSYDTMRLVDQAVDEVNTTRAELGAFQKNTLESNLTQLRITTENLISAESTIRDVDMAAEMAEFTRNTVMFQASAAMLAHANSIPRTILGLLD